MFLLFLACAPGTITVPSDTGAGSATPEDSGNDTDTAAAADTAADCACDDGLDCTTDSCDDQDRCIYTSVDTCAWPAALPPDVTGLGELEVDFGISLSGAAWNADSRQLWVVRGDGAQAWSLVEDGAGGWKIEYEVALGEIDAESVVVVDPVGKPAMLHVLVEHEEVVRAFDVSDPAVPLPRGFWDTSPWLEVSGSRGSEGMAFVPDEALAEWGFTDADGALRTSSLGLGGLFFVGTQNGGAIHVFDLSATDETVEEVGVYQTARDDTSALEFDPDTGRLYVWHGGANNDLEIVRLSSTKAGAERSFDSEAVFDYPGNDNLEGMALMGTEDCGDEGRPMFFTMDDGGTRALDVYPNWPLCGP